jgi:hypothetical protein
LRNGLRSSTLTSLSNYSGNGSPLRRDESVFGVADFGRKPPFESPAEVCGALPRRRYARISARPVRPFPTRHSDCGFQIVHDLPQPGLCEQVVERLELPGHLHRPHDATEVALLPKNSTLINPSRSFHHPPRATPPPPPPPHDGTKFGRLNPPAGSRDQHLDLKRLVATDKTPATTALRSGRRALGSLATRVRACLLRVP